MNPLFRSGRQAIVGTLTTARLQLRPVRGGDLASIIALAGDWQVARMLSDMPHPLDVSEASAWLDHKPGDLALVILLERHVIGAVTAYRDRAPPGEPVSAELGFWLGRSWWGYGFAREAVSAVIERAFANRQRRYRLDAFTSGHFADNPSSAKILTGLGFKPAGQTQVWCLARGVLVPSLTYRLDRPEL